jgi:hypothetical protein
VGPKAGLDVEPKLDLRLVSRRYTDCINPAPGRKLQSPNFTLLLQGSPGAEDSQDSRSPRAENRTPGIRNTKR